VELGQELVLEQEQGWELASGREAALVLAPEPVLGQGQRLAAQMAAVERGVALTDSRWLRG